jgi:50S ribosomal protein L4, bacterial/organelle
MLARIYSYGGGKAFGPHPRDYSYNMPRKARKLGLISALSLKKKDGKLLIVEDLNFSKIKTKDGLQALSKLGVSNCLFVVDGVNENFEKSVRNIPGIKVLRCEGLNVYDIMKYDHTVLTLAALNKVQEVKKP